MVTFILWSIIQLKTCTFLCMLGSCKFVLLNHVNALTFLQHYNGFSCMWANWAKTFFFYITDCFRQNQHKGLCSSGFSAFNSISKLEKIAVCCIVIKHLYTSLKTYNKQTYTVVMKNMT